jgi:Ca-activated chloride channel family protein
MKALRILTPLLAGSLGLTLLLVAQQGPSNQNGETVARPKKGSTPAPAESAPPTDKDQSKIPSQYSNKGKELPQGVATFSSESTSVSVEVAVLTNQGQFIPKIPQGNFRVLEDNVPQKISSFSVGEAPMTICMVIEFSNRFQRFYTETWYQTLTAAYEFVRTLKSQDYLAVVAYDLKPEILSDFSTNREDAQEALSRLKFAAYSEANLFDAVVDTAQRMQDIEGRKAILLISTGVDTFSKLNFGEARKAIQNAGVPIYTIGLGQAMRNVGVATGAISDFQNMDFLQADNQLRTFAKESGGMSFFPAFYGQFPEIYRSIRDTLANQYVLTYSPTNQVKDGKYRKIKVELVDPNTNQPLRVNDQKGKALKYEIIAKTGYTAPRAVE